MGKRSRHVLFESLELLVEQLWCVYTIYLKIWTRLWPSATHNWSLKQWATCTNDVFLIYWHSNSSLVQLPQLPQCFQLAENLKINTKPTHSYTYTSMHIYTMQKHLRDCKATGNVKQLDSSYENKIRKVEPKVWIPLSSNTVIKCYIPFMKKRVKFKTYNVDMTWRQTVENFTVSQAWSWQKHTTK